MVTIAVDMEASIVVDRLGQQTREPPITGPGSNPGPSTQRHKQARSPEGKGNDDNGKYLPHKSARLHRSSTRSMQVV
jgi:hypothetical protein